MARFCNRLWNVRCCNMLQKILNNEEREYKNPLQQTITTRCFVFAFVLCFLMGVLAFFIYRTDMIGRYEAYTRDTIDLVARRIDGDDLEECIRTKKKSPKYDELQEFMNDVKEVYDLEFLYIILPISDHPPDNMMDVLAASTAAGRADGTDGLTDLGNYTGDLYPPEVAREYLVRMERDPRVTFFRNDTDFGNIYTAIRPILNSRGEPIAVLCADVLVNDINMALTRFAGLSLVAAVVSGILLMLVMSLWLRRRIVEPIARLRSSAASFAERTHGRDGADGIEAFSFDDPDIHTGDEIEALSASLSSMCGDMRAYAEELIKSEQKIDSMQARVKKMNALAYRDALTGAGNKAAYEKEVIRLDWEIMMDRAKFVLIMVDLNYLKRVNDTFGHDHGNLYIQKMYSMLQNAFSEDPIFRIGGDEFIVLANQKERQECEARAERLKKEMEQMSRNHVLEPWEKVSTAIGIAEYQSDKDMSVSEVFQRADEAMYADKRAMRAGRE